MVVSWHGSRLLREGERTEVTSACVARVEVQQQPVKRCPHVEEVTVETIDDCVDAVLARRRLHQSLN
jgi:hypothetical protein